MPGLSVVRGRDAFDDATLDAALDSLRFRDDYERETLYADGEYLVAATAYPSYPVRRVETDDWIAVLDGRLYDVADEDVPATLERVGRWAVEGDDAALEKWLAARDGDFVILALPRGGGDAVVVNDALGRLPVFRASVGGADVVTREPKLVTELARRAGDRPVVDRLGVAQTLVFGYRLGSRTLFEGVDRLPPGSRTTLGEGGAPTAVRVHDFGRRPHGSKSVDENAARLAEKFVTACRNRSDAGTTTVVSLSGGLDSRAAAAGYRAAGVPFVTATFDRVGGNTAPDVRAAREVANVLDAPWTSYRVRRDEADMRELLDVMQGTNSVSMGHMVEFLSGVAADHDAPVLVTGDGGDKAFPDLRPRRSFDSLDGLLRYVLEANSIFSPADAAAIARVDEDRLVASVRERLASYPESSLSDRYVHFYARERGINWLNLGEDRNRHYCWSVSPFYALPFFTDAMGCPGDQKARSRLYRRFIAELAPEVLDVEYADFGAPVTSAEYAVKRFAYDTLTGYPRLKDSLLGLVTGRNRVAPDGEAARHLRSRIEASEAVEAMFDVSAVDRALRERSVETRGVYDLATVAAMVGNLYAEPTAATPRKK